MGIKQAGLPNIEGSFRGAEGVATSYGQLGAFYPRDYDYYIPATRMNEKTYPRETLLDASRSNPIYGNSSTVQPPSIVLIPQLRY